MTTYFKYQVFLAPFCTMEDVIKEISTSLMLHKHHICSLKYKGSPFISCTEAAAADLITSDKVPSITHMQQIALDVKTVAL